MKDYTKILENSNINLFDFVTEYNIVENGIYISYADKTTVFEEVENENDLLKKINSIEEEMKLQARIIFTKLYDNDNEKIYQELKKHKNDVNKNSKILIIILALAIALTVNLYYTPSFINLLFVILSSSFGIRKANKNIEMNEILNAELEFVKRIEFLQKEEELNKAIEKDFDLILKGTKKNTKLIAKKNLKNGLPAITMNYIDEININDIHKMVNNMIDKERQEFIKFINNALDEINDKEIDYTKVEENTNSNNYNYKHDLTENNNNNTYEEDLTENKAKSKVRKKND